VPQGTTLPRKNIGPKHDVSRGNDSGNQDIPQGEGRKMVELKSMSGSAPSQGAGCNADVTMLSQLQQYI
jgi:hypothetical protein